MCGVGLAPYSLRRVRGFSLVELLVTVTIIGLLAALSFPSLNRARERARIAGCASNLSQIGKAMMLYAADNDGCFPPARESGLPWPMAYWPYKVNPYLANIKDSNAGYYALCFNGVMRDPGKKDWNINGPTDYQRISYGMNSFSTAEQLDIRKRVASIDQPSKTMLVSDTAMAYPVLNSAKYLYTYYPCQRHFVKDNVLFCDGHVEAVPKDGMDVTFILK